MKNVNVFFHVKETEKLYRGDQKRMRRSKNVLFFGPIVPLNQYAVGLSGSQNNGGFMQGKFKQLHSLFVSLLCRDNEYYRNV